MAEQEGPITKSDIIEESAIKAPLELAENFDLADATVKKFVTDAKALGNAVPKTNSLTEMQKVLKQLTDQEKQIVDLQKKLNDQFKSSAPKDNTNAMKQLRQAYKDAVAEMARIQKELGADSEAFTEATKKAGELKDEIKDLTEAASDASGGSGLERLSSQTKRFGEQIKTLDFKGAGSTLKQLAATTKGLTFKESIDGAGGFSKSLLQLGKNILTNPLFILIGIIIGIAVAIYKLKDDIKVIDEVFQFFGKTIGWVVQQVKDFLDWIGLTSFAVQKQTDDLIKANEKQRKAIERRYDSEIAIAQAAGKEVLKLEEEKERALIDNLARTVLAIDTELRLNKNLTTERKKELKAQRDSFFELLEDQSTALQVTLAKELVDEKAKNKKVRDDLFELQKFRLQVQIETNEAIAKDANNSEASRVDAARKALDERKTLADLERKHELDQEKLNANQIKLINEKSANDKLKARKIESDDEEKIYQDEKKKRDEQNAAELAEFKKKFFQQIKIGKQYISEYTAMIQRGLELEIRAIKQAVIAGTMTRTQGEQAITNILRTQTDEQIQIQIDAVKKTLESVALSVDERKALYEELYKLQVDLENALYDQQQDKLPKQLAAIKQAYDTVFGALTQLFDSFSQNRLDQIQNEEDAITKQHDNAIKAAGDNKKEQEKIDRDYAAKQSALEVKRKEEQRKKAIYDKAVALLGAQIALSQAIVEAMTAGPGIGQALAIATAAAGAIQIAAIIARKIPSYEKGVRNAPGGISRVSEKGSELMVTDAGAFLTPSKESFIDVPKGADIYNHDQTMRMLSRAGMVENGGRQMRSTDNFDLLRNDVRTLTRVMRDKPTTQWNISSRGVEKLLRNGETRTKFLQSTYK